jgi:hypothetical protein
MSDGRLLVFSYQLVKATTYFDMQTSRSRMEGSIVCVSDPSDKES